jgi:multicomponent Na+:H+ antiporter subunit E
MITVLMGLLLAFAWVALTGQFTPADLAFGFGLGILLVWLTRRQAATATLERARRWVSLVVFFLWQLVVANIRVTLSVLGPRSRLRPAVVAVPLDLRSDAGITLLANLITLTPGTLSLDVATDRQTLYVHIISTSDVAAARREIKDGFERRVREVLE